jgi:2-polyprenyl-6-hydroxyphenyl methylase/3-demethylubiquinone-9 3-methyltransferase
MGFAPCCAGLDRLGHGHRLTFGRAREGRRARRGFASLLCRGAKYMAKRWRRDGILVPHRNRPWQRSVPAVIEPEGFCKICGAEAPVLGALDFNRSCEERQGKFLPPSGIRVEYRRCPGCGFIFTNHCDGWSRDEFLQRIYNDGYLAVDPEYEEQRPHETAHVVRDMFPDARHTIRILDFGGGNGRCAEFIKMNHYDAVSYDPLLGGEVPPHEAFDLILCVDVLQHLPDPVASFDAMLEFLKPGGMLLMKTGLAPDEATQNILNWWYIAPRNGHISIFSTRAMVKLLAKFGMNGGTFGDWHFGFMGRPPAFAEHLFVGARQQIVR